LSGVPVAHGDGRFTADEETLRQLEARGQVVLRYVSADGSPARGGENPNGSANDIAGISTEAGNVVGLMPHPDRATDSIVGLTDGLGFFKLDVTAGV
jgi:phosphoribosylformylglycinamidine synthase